ncbi:DUF2207 domain-containing protein [Lysinibacter sp. HNR]|uniref:DUF2207 domain-containing protein n=1 Tax=Lysinibacter sp. HNR TaxID=3031408 RepID=UPI0024349AB8|nr:DUF2207 domain-containing protein [Lysinibacter sp. HNR]WGD37376.1 DUF2207 domain-containing protein [Lysinibacter sp. HNR]
MLLGFAITVLFGSLTITPQPAAANVNDFRFSSFNAQYLLGRSIEGQSQLTTVETLVAQFPDHPQNRGIIRYIPLDYNGVDLNTRLSSVTNERGEAVPYEATHESGFLAVSIGTDEYLLGEHTFVLTYEQVNVVRDFGDTDANEFYWDTNGTSWAQPFDSVEVELRLAPELVDSLNGNMSCYSGAQGSADTCAIEQDPNDPAFFQAFVDGGVAPEENMTIAVGFDRGTFVIPAAPGQHWAFTVFPLLWTGLGLASVVMLAVSRARVWRAPQGRGIVVPQYTIPKNVNLLEAQNIVSSGMGAVSAQLVSFAVRHNVRIFDYAVTKKGSKIKNPFTLEFRSLEGLDDLEIELIHVFFGPSPSPGDIVELVGPSAGRAAKLHSLMSEVGPRMLARGWRARPAAPFPKLWIIFSSIFATFIFGSITLAFVLPAFNGSTLAAILGLLAMFVAAAFILTKPAQLTVAGVEMREYIQGLRMYLELAEKDRFAMLQSVSGAERVPFIPESAVGLVDPADRVEPSDPRAIVNLYEKLLPYAILWNIEESWTRALSVHYEQLNEQPDWFVSANAFNAVSFNVAMAGFSAQTMRSTSAPASSSSGGSFSGGSTGGGFSGGGGGGGGGGGR